MKIRPAHCVIPTDAIIGNPPYQEEGISTRKSPIYHLFYDLSFRLSDRVSLITPGRFLYKVGQTPKEWMNKMLDDVHFTVVDYFKKSTDVFPSVDIKGGVAITYRDAAEILGPIGFFSEYEELKSIVKKVLSHHEFVKDKFSGLISSQGLYKFSEAAFNEHPEISKVQGKGTAAKITSNAFEHLPQVFMEHEPARTENFIRILGRIKNQRTYKWIDKRYILPTDGYCESYNVLVPEANGTGAIGEVLSTPVIGTPVIGHTDTFLSIGKFSDARQADRCLKYVKSKFARCMLGTLKATQHNPRETWANVPMQDFTSVSDINWDVPVSEIDKQLYAKYQLSDEEILFIEQNIKPME